MSLSQHAILASAALILTAGLSCKPEPAEPAPPPDPKRCELVDLGEASTLVESGTIPDDQFVRVTGLGHPGSLVWQDQTTKQAYFLTRLMGAQRRLFYMQELAPGETPKVLSVFEGHIRRWDRLPPQRAVPMAGALKKDYRIEIEPDKTYLIVGGAKPDGCP